MRPPGSCRPGGLAAVREYLHRDIRTGGYAGNLDVKLSGKDVEDGGTFRTERHEDAPQFGGPAAIDQILGSDQPLGAGRGEIVAIDGGDAARQEWEAEGRGSLSAILVPQPSPKLEAVGVRQPDRPPIDPASVVECWGAEGTLREQPHARWSGGRLGAGD